MRTFDAKQKICALNKVRAQYTSPLRKKDMTSLLVKVGLPKSSTFFAALLKEHIVANFGKDWYMFASEPIHFATLQTAYDAYLRKTYEYQETWKQNKKVAENLRPNSEVRKAVELLQSLGFEIRIPVGSPYSKI